MVAVAAVAIPPRQSAAMWWRGCCRTWPSCAVQSAPCPTQASSAVRFARRDSASRCTGACARASAQRVAAAILPDTPCQRPPPAHTPPRRAASHTARERPAQHHIVLSMYMSTLLLPSQATRCRQVEWPAITAAGGHQHLRMHQPPPTRPATQHSMGTGTRCLQHILGVWLLRFPCAHHLASNFVHRLLSLPVH